MDGDKDKGVVVFAGKKRAKSPRQKAMMHPAHSMPTKPWRRFVKLSVVLLMLLVVFGVYRYLVDHTGPSYQCNGRANSPIYGRAAKVMNPGATAALGQVVNDMKDMKNYRHDPTCLYVATVYSLQANNPQAARESYDLLAKVYDTKKPNVLSLGPEQLKSLPQLSFEVTRLENQSTTEQQDFQNFNKVAQ
jgi:hypothetical protein